MCSRPLISLLAVVSVLALASCASNRSAPPRSATVSAPTPATVTLTPSPARSTRATNLVGEIYEGPPAVAVSPVVEGRRAASPEVSSWWLQKLLSDEIDRSDLFAGVIPLESYSEAHEADLLIQPALTALDWTRPNQRSGTISMRIRATHVPTGEVRLDRVYTASCRDCKVAPGQPPVAGPLTVLAQDVIRDLSQASR